LYGREQLKSNTIWEQAESSRERKVVTSALGDDGLDVRLGRRRRRVEHETLPVAIRRIYAIQENFVNVWVTPEVTVGALDDGNRAVLAAGNAPIRRVLAIAGRYGVGEDAQDLAQQFPVEGQRKSQRKRQREDKLSAGHLGQNVV
jgi:hypothetical protein